jgi:acyl carrier protein
MNTLFTNFKNEFNSFLTNKFEIKHEIDDKLKITDALGLDSLDLIDLVVFIEEEFNVKIKAEDFANFSCLNDLSLFVYEKK